MTGGPDDAEPIGDQTVLAGDRPAGPRETHGIARGDEIGRYTVLDRLGAGGMGVVYSAYDPELDRRVAIKVIKARSSAGIELSEGAGRLLREAQALAQLAHPNVVTVHDVGMRDGGVWVAMEYVDGGTLDDWMEERHPWREVLLRFVAAGRGLVAAHAGAIVHRDFKPANVLLGTDGRVLVADFGLARQDGASPEPKLEAKRETTRPHPAPRRPSASLASLSIRLTETGVLMGTPAYMAPEQIAGEPADARSDQFSFCVALYEALYGERPYGGDSLASIAFAAEQGNIHDAPRDSDVPRWVRRAVVRGLAPKPDDRHPDMASLLRALDRGPARRRTITVATLLGGSLVAAAVMASRAPGPSPTLCRGGPELIDSVYDETQRQAVLAGVSRANTDHARQTADRVVARLDEFRADWETMYRDACEATNVRGEQSTELLDRRMTCLERRRRHLGSVSEVLATADAKFVNKAVGLVETLAPVAGCADREALLATTPPPSDPATRARIAELSADVDHVHVLRRAVRNDEALELAESTLASAREIDHAPLVAEAILARGAMAEELDDKKGESWLEDAFTTALASGADRVAARSAQRLIATHKAAARYDQAEHWIDLALATATRIGSPDDVLGAIYTNVGNLRAAQGRPTDAIEAHQLARRHYSEAMGPDHEQVADTYYNESAARWGLGEIDRAAKLVEKAVAIWSVRLGPDHPRTIAGGGAQALFEWRRGDLQKALRLITVTIERRESVYGKDHSLVADGLMNLGAIQRQAGQLEEAKATLLRCIEIRTKTKSAEHPDTAAAVGNLAAVLLDLGELDAALERAELPVKAYAAPGAEPTVWGAIALAIRGEIRLARGELDLARTDLHASLTMRSALPERDEGELREPHALLAVTEARAGNAETARTHIARVRSVGGGLDEAEPFDRAYMLELLADAGWAIGERAAARQDAEAARAGFAPDYPSHVKAIETWLREHPK